MANNRNREVASLVGVQMNSLGRILFENVNLSLKVGEITVVRGEAGSGKSQLLRVVAGQELPDSGRVHRRGDILQIYVTATSEGQPLEDSTQTVRQYFLASRGLLDLGTRIEALEKDMSSSNQSSLILNQYGQLTEQYQRLGGYTAEREITQTLRGLNVAGQSTRIIDLDTRLDQVSSGQRTKLAIGKAFFSNADLIILDNPTAHLDTSSVQWLISRINRKDKAVIVASNDNRIATTATQIIQIENGGRIFSYQGGLDGFERKRTAQLEAERTSRTALVRQRDELQATYNRFKSEGSFRRSKDFAATGRSMQSRLGRMNAEISAMPNVSVDLPQTRRSRLLIQESGHQVADSSIVIKNVVKTYGGKGGVDTSALGEIRVKKGERLIISGKNGSGKSTLLRVIANELIGIEGNFRPEKGQVVVNSRQRIGYLAPDHMELVQNHSILEEVLLSMESSNESRATNLLVAMGFDRHRLRSEKVRSLSVGEKQQLALAKLISSNPDVLILDEPTSNLRADIVTRLVEALNKYSGTLILVDHNPDFIRKIQSTRVVNLSANVHR